MPLTHRAFLRAAVVASTVLLFALPALARAQAEGIEFRVEIFRVDLVRDDDGEITERFIEVSEAVPGEQIEYRIVTVNEGDVIHRPGTVVVTLPIGEGLAYVADSAGPSDDERIIIEFSADGGETFSEPPVILDEDGDRETAEAEDYDQIRWTFTEPFEPGQEETLYYRVEVL